MTVFRPWKPWVRLGLAANLLHGPGLQPVGFTVDDGNGEITWGGAGTSAVIIEKAGHYQVSAGLRREGIATAASAIASIRLNGVLFVGQTSDPSTGGRYLSLATDLQLDEGDVIDYVVNAHPTLVATLGAAGTFLTVARCGPVRHT